MIRRKFMKFAPKEHSDEKVKKNLEKHNVPTFEGHQPSKFGQFSAVAKDLAAKNRKNFITPEGGHVASAERTFSFQQKAIYGGGGGGAPPATSDPRNPYAVVQPKENPYSRAPAPAMAQAASNPYGGGGSGGYGNPYGGRTSGGDAAASGANSYGGRGSSDGVASMYPSQSSTTFGKSPGPSTLSNDTYDTDPHGSEARDFGSDPASKQAYGSVRSFPTETSSYSDRFGGGDAFGDDAFDPLNGSESTIPERPAHKAEFDEPDTFGAPLARTSTNQTTASTAAARQALFGAAPTASRKLPTFGEDDELNQLPDELNDPGVSNPDLSRVPPGRVPDDEDELNYSPQDFASRATSQGYDEGYGAGQDYTQSSRPQLDDPLEDEDELNQLPSELSRQETSATSIRRSYQNYGEVHAPHDYDDEDDRGYVTGDQLFDQQDSEDEDVEYVKREIRQTKQETVESTRRALQIASEAETSGRNALGMLGDQGERLGNSAKTVQLGGVQARVGEENADELMRLNRSIFIPNVSNPFNSRRRNQMKAARLQGQQVYDRLEREELDRLQRESEQRVSGGLNGSGAGYSETALRVRQRMNRDNPERKMYQFEADSDDDALEDELDQNLDGMHGAAKRLHQLSLNINDEVNSQNKRIEEMGGRVDDLDHRLHKSTAKMATIN